MTAVEAGYRETVHHCEDDAEECCHAPELFPDEAIREDAADGDEAAEALVGAGARLHDELELFPVVAELLAGLLETLRY